MTDCSLIFLDSLYSSDFWKLHYQKQYFIERSRVSQRLRPRLGSGVLAGYSKSFKLERCGWNNVFLESRSDRDFGVKMSVTFFGRQNVEYLLLLYQTCHQQLTFSWDLVWDLSLNFWLRSKVYLEKLNLKSWGFMENQSHFMTSFGVNSSVQLDELNAIDFHLWPASD